MGETLVSTAPPAAAPPSSEEMGIAAAYVLITAYVNIDMAGAATENARRCLRIIL